MSCLSGNIHGYASLRGVLEAVNGPIIASIERDVIYSNMVCIDGALHGDISVDIGIQGTLRQVCSAMRFYAVAFSQDVLTFGYDDTNQTRKVTLTANSAWQIDAINGFNIMPQQGEAGTYDISITPTYINEGADIQVQVKAICGDKTSTLTLVHEGKRQPYGVVGGGVYRVIGGGRYLVLKTKN